MQQLSIRCHPCAPALNAEVDRWLAEEVERLRDRAPHAAVRLLRLSQAMPTGEAGVGWLIELVAMGGGPPLDASELTQVVRDLRLLGLQPTVLQTGNGRP